MVDVSEPLVITFLSDYGWRDDFVGVCHGVIARACPAARVIDLAHEVPRHDVTAGALLLAASLDYVPRGVHLAVVDPGVGSDRRAVALRCADGRYLVGPDNGLLAPAAARAGGVAEAVELSASPFALTPVSVTFHGRDLFAPVAAALAGGTAVAACGERLDPGSLRAASLTRAHRDGATLHTHVQYVDAFGNLQLDADAELAPAGTVALSSGERALGRASPGRTFADVDPGELVLYEDAHRRLAVAVNRGSAARALGLAVGDELAIGAA